MNKRIISIIIISILLLGYTGYKLSNNKKQREKEIYIHDLNAEVLVETTQAIEHTFENAYNYLGTFEPNLKNTLGSDAQGKIISISIKEGSNVSQGQVLAKVDDEMLRLQLENAEIALQGQKNDDNRYSILEKEKAVTGVQVEKTRLGMRSAENQKRQIQKQLQNTSIKAPFSGVITKKLIDLGSIVGPGTPLFEITDISSLKLKILVPENEILKFKLNQTVPVKVDIYKDRVFQGKVTHLGIQADNSHNFTIEITIPNAKQEILSGMYGTVSLDNNQSKTTLAVPRKALIGSTKNPQVYIIRNGRAILTSFQSGISDGTYIEVINGLSQSDQIVIKGQVNLQNNSKVKTSK